MLVSEWGEKCLRLVFDRAALLQKPLVEDGCTAKKIDVTSRCPLPVLITMSTIHPVVEKIQFGEIFCLAVH